MLAEKRRQTPKTPLHNKHQKSYPKAHLGDFEKTLKTLQKNGLLNMFPHSGDREPHVCAILEHDTLQEGIKTANRYREAVNLPPWDNEFNELVEK